MKVVGGTQEGAEHEVLGASIKALLELFYANDGLIIFPESARIQGSFDALTDLFDHVGLRTN